MKLTSQRTTIYFQVICSYIVYMIIQHSCFDFQQYFPLTSSAKKPPTWLMRLLRERRTPSLWCSRWLLVWSLFSACYISSTPSSLILEVSWILRTSLLMQVSYSHQRLSITISFLERVKKNNPLIIFIRYLRTIKGVDNYSKMSSNK